MELWPRAQLYFTHRSGSTICLPIGRALSIGSTPESDLLITGNQLPAHLCQVHYRQRRYWLKHENQQQIVKWNETYQLQGFTLKLTRINWFKSIFSRIATLAVIMITSALLYGFHPKASKTVHATNNNTLINRPTSDYNEVQLHAAIKALSFKNSPAADYANLILQLTNKSRFYLQETPHVERLLLSLSEKLEELLFKISMNIGLGREQQVEQGMDELFRLLPKPHQLTNPWLKQQLRPIYQRIVNWRESYAQRS